MTQQCKLQYLYRVLTQYRRKMMVTEVDPFSFCQFLNIVILEEPDDDLFFAKEDAYYLIYPDQKSCIVIRHDIAEELKRELLTYMAIRITFVKKFGCDGLIQTIERGIQMESYILSKHNDYHDLCYEVMCEALLPSSELPIYLYQQVNAKKIAALAHRFHVRPEFIVNRLQGMQKSARGLLSGISISSYKQSSILDRYLKYNQHF
ncbi:MAG: hypothetical protein HFG15_04540 [Bacilli bacterium]|jgi:hypothetical protein|nr:hypothetical protein [Bacilli bacterium]